MLRFLLLSLSIITISSAALAMSGTGERVVVENRAGEEFTYRVELATTPEEQAKGLMHRPFMSDDAGMLFIFPRTGLKAFWMKNTIIPLDIIYIDEFGNIECIFRNTIPFDETPLKCDTPVIAVLEVNGGQTQKHNIQVGDKIHHKVFLAESDIIVY